MKRYACLACDPPWQHGDSLGPRGARANYETMSVDEICGLARPKPKWWEKHASWTDTSGKEAPSPIKPPMAIAMCGKKFRLADDCILFLWRLASMPNGALQVVSAWGFEPKTEIVWVKTTGEADDAMITSKGDRYGQLVKVPVLHFGMGRSVRGAHETCIVATRGKYSKLIKNHSTRSVFFAPVPRDSGGRIIHSAKPPAFYTLVENLCKGPRLELFARERRDGWKCSGRELEE
jgi:N6-adenosine-specific RNA methylase IME4